VIAAFLPAAAFFFIIIVAAIMGILLGTGIYIFTNDVSQHACKNCMGIDPDSCMFNEK
jgi:hypothetical protein